MLKRIEVYFDEEPAGWYGCAGALMLTGLSYQLPAPKKRGKGVFYFTQKGFEKFGRSIIKEISLSDSPIYRILSISNKCLSINYRDGFQVRGTLKKKSWKRY